MRETDASMDEQIVRMALSTVQGQLFVNQAKEYLRRELALCRFNIERASEVLGIAVDNSMWAFVKGMPLYRRVYSDYKKSNEGRKAAGLLVQKFIDETGATNQRPARKFLRFLLGA